MRRRWIIVAAVGLALLTLVSLTVEHLPIAGISQQYILPEKEIHHGDLNVVAYSVELRADSIVEGSAAIIATDSVLVGGTIQGDLSIYAPTVEIKIDKHLQVNGDFSLCSRNNTTERESITVSGEYTADCKQLPTTLNGNGFPQLNIPIFNRYSGNLFARLSQMIANAIMVAVIAALGVNFFPGRFRRITEAAISAPVTAGIVGFLSVGTAVALTVIYFVLSALTLGLLCLAFPLVALSWVIITSTLVIGWIAISLPLGAAIVRRLNWPTSPMIIAATGALCLTFVQGIIEITPCVSILGGLMLLVLGSAGLGGVILTHFGRHPYPEYITIKRKNSEIV